MNGADPRAVRARLGRRGLGRRAHPRRRRAARTSSSRTPPSTSPRSAASTPTTYGGPRGSSARARRVLSTVLQGFYQSHQATAASVAVHNLHLLRGMIGRPGRGRPADERPAHRAEQPRVRRRRRPARLPQLGQPGPRRSSSPTLWNVDAHDHPALGAADPRDADLPLRRDRARSACCGSRPPTRRSRCPSPRRIRRILGRRPVLRRRPGPVPDRDRASSPTSCCRPPAGARRPAASPTPTAPSTSPSRPSSRPARPAATSTSS